MDSIKISVPISRELLDFVIDEILKTDQDPMVLHARIAQSYGLSPIEGDIVLAYLEKEGVMEADIYGIPNTEFPRYYTVYSSNKIRKANRSEAVNSLMEGNKIVECERNKMLLEVIIKILANKKYSFKEIRDEVENFLGEKIDWIVLMIHLLELQKEKIIGKGFIKRDGHNAEYYYIMD